MLIFDPKLVDAFSIKIKLFPGVRIAWKCVYERCEARKSWLIIYLGWQKKRIFSRVSQSTEWRRIKVSWSCLFATWKFISYFQRECRVLDNLDFYARGALWAPASRWKKRKVDWGRSKLKEGGRGKCKEGSRVEDGSQKRLEEAWKRGFQVVFCVPVCSFSLYAFLSFTPGNLYPWCEEMRGAGTKGRGGDQAA